MYNVFLLQVVIDWTNKQDVKAIREKGGRRSRYERDERKEEIIDFVRHV
jgi:hypothetical protein